MLEFEETVAKKLGWQSLRLRDESKTTQSRPKIEDISATTKASIIRANQLDMQLYEFAQKLLRERVDQNSK
jgi:hypothetical protein